MTEYQRFARELVEHVLAVVAAKNHDYAGEDSDPLWNFDMAAAVTRRPTAEVIVSRMADKLSRLANAARQEMAVDEDPKQTVEDMIGYSILAAWALRRQQLATEHARTALMEKTGQTCWPTPGSFDVGRQAYTCETHEGGWIAGMEIDLAEQNGVPFTCTKPIPS